jgi:hypothetical protein
VFDEAKVRCHRFMIRVFWKALNNRSQSNRGRGIASKLISGAVELRHLSPDSAPATIGKSAAPDRPDRRRVTRSMRKLVIGSPKTDD